MSTFRSDMAGTSPTTGEVTVYSITDAAGRTLYIGQTNDVARRLTEHEKNSVWWPDAAGLYESAGHTRAEAVDLERHLIKMCHPLFNIHHGHAIAARQLRAIYAVSAVIARLEEAS